MDSEKNETVECGSIQNRNDHMEKKAITSLIESDKQKVKELTSRMFHLHYCENDVEGIIRMFDDELLWFGAGEQEYEVDCKKIADIFRQFAGMVPKCTIADEEYEVLPLAEGVYLCTGRMWITTDPSIKMYLRVHQRFSTIFRCRNQELRCCHIHISNPYSEMSEQDVGFPTQMGQQTYEYLQECIQEQKSLIEKQTAMLQRMSYEDLLTGLFNRNKFERMIEEYKKEEQTVLGVACFDLNGLKEINDAKGHRAGDIMICQASKRMNEIFCEKVYRIGGDEFVVLEDTMDEKTFQEATLRLVKNIENDGYSISFGVCWRNENLSILEQYDEADQLMYKNKAAYYTTKGHDRRKR